ncbi:hypothetical protein [Virgibacillus halodenitrificans]|uniref:hypothetical protein n=1 Tax=Virgibacillus halodenitrificans TaxID=1482 RepID=UPI000EF51190|nr:hypothetical protein [Virgibacillus halodenitrificans]
MGNQFTKHGKEIVKSEFLRERIYVNNESHVVYKYLPRLEDIIFCMAMAKVKSGYTMNASQANLPREDYEKVSKAFNGILAEFVIHRFLLIVIGIREDHIKRFDLERDRFNYTRDEYDLKIFLNNVWYDIESRSSISYKTNLKEAFEKYHVIGPYFNEAKVSEDYNAIYLRPLYQYKDVRFRNKEELLDLMKDYYKNRVDLYLMTGAFKEDFDKYGYQKDMGQNSTAYTVVNIRDVGGLDRFIRRFNEKFL